MATVSIPLLLADATSGTRHAEVEGSTIDEIIAALDALHPGIGPRLREGSRISPTVAFTVDGRIAARGLATKVKPQSEIHILPSFGGG